MSKESFNWKSLFINEEANKSESSSQEPQTVIPANKFPEVNAPVNIPSNSNNPFLNEILEVYQKGFEGLNHEGFDFFELYKSVSAVGVTNPQSYQMAFAMGKSLNPGLSKEVLMEKAKHYLSEIDKVHQKYDATGNAKKSDLNNKLTQEKNTLTKAISDLELKISELQKELDQKKSEFEKVDLHNQEDFSQIELKIEANNIARQRIVDSINTVLTGVNQYL
ncbi:kinetochore protein SPC24 [Flavobacterium amniphilum]|uniref:kinetochore protein SPC24 n=1 Tax=Flavobacterium amniphilum TaxID=1834035 RepID=UPI00202A7EDB|nr:kinetochore protein SPC24 [Flavobacterium amniphilum]MCL9804070.1 kinetochore protein SPC24 [Flavobacterium amniphilum]